MIHVKCDYDYNHMTIFILLCLFLSYCLKLLSELELFPHYQA